MVNLSINTKHYSTIIGIIIVSMQSIIATTTVKLLDYLKYLKGKKNLQTNKVK